MNIARIISSITIGGTKAFAKALSASGGQMVKNFNYKPEGLENSGSASSSTQKAGAKANNVQFQMSLDEAHLILNVKKDESMEVIQKHYDAIFAANGPPPEPTTPKPAAPAKPGPKRKAPTHSHYLQSKVYRALERIKAERGEMEAKTQDPTVNAAETLGAAAATIKAQGQAAEGSTTTTPPPPKS